MSLMSKLLTSTLIATIALSANSVPDNKLLVKYVKRNIVKNPQVEVKGVTVIESTTHKDLPGWDILLTTMDLKYQKKDIHVPETMFIKDGLITGHLVNLKTGRDYRNEIKPTVPNSMYDDAHLLYGNKNAKHKIIVFSDPMCPFCQEVVPEIMKAAKEHPDTIALYYYHLPLLRIHPVSGTLTKIMHQAQQEGKKDVVEKMYSLKIDPRTTDLKKILPAVKKHTGYEITEEKLKDKKLLDAMKADEDTAGRMMVSGTPTVYIDGKWDKMRDGYKKLIK
ncbi:MAG: thioredoxin domain-containing protein [Sulfurovum sp.]|nr:thioredoxin domain-containing protein [Sulfurovum sp.]